MKLACMLSICLLSAAPALAQDAAPPAATPAPEAAPPQCPDKPDIPEPWRSWVERGEATAGYVPSGTTGLVLGRPVDATLRPTAQVTFAAPPGKAVEPDSYAGLFRLKLARPARIGLALSAGAWVDVIAGGKAMESVEHGHGPDCSGIRKIVWFDLPAGSHTVQVANAPAPTIRIMAADKNAYPPVK